MHSDLCLQNVMKTLLFFLFHFNSVFSTAAGSQPSESSCPAGAKGESRGKRLKKVKAGAKELTKGKAGGKGLTKREKENAKKEATPHGGRGVSQDDDNASLHETGPQGSSVTYALGMRFHVNRCCRIAVRRAFLIIGFSVKSFMPALKAAFLSFS